MAADTVGGVEEAAGAVAERLRSFVPEVGIVLGSGLGSLAERVDNAVRISYNEIPGLPLPTVQGHGGEFVAGRLEGRPVLLQRGRIHFYEGRDSSVVVLPVRMMAALGVQVLIVTNAAGGTNPAFRPPCLMIIADHINLMFRAPLAGPVVGGEQRFPDMSQPYDPALRAAAWRVALEQKVTMHEGVYAAVLGPSFETPAEVRMLQRLGADAIGMSTVPEVIVARALGLRVLGISTITNLAAGISPTALSHEEVLEAGAAVARDLEAVVRGVLRTS